MPENTATAASIKDMANAIRALSMDAVQKANSGHPGLPMGMADVATVLFSQTLKFDPGRPDWPDRDRFVLSAGHGSMLLYALLYLTGYERPTLDDIRNFRQLGSPCAGHPEYGELPGIETTTGPLGQGLGMAVGMAIAERHLNARFGDELVDHRTYAIAGDGCLMEGISHEAASLAGHLGLSRLTVLWDDNSISIDGPTDLAVSDDQCARFRALGWHVSRADGHDPASIAAALDEALASDKPSLVACRTIIGYGAPNKQGTAATHGAPLGEDEIAAARDALGWPHSAFEIPDDILAAWRATAGQGHAEAKAWQARLESAGDDLQAGFMAATSGRIPARLDEAINKLKQSLVDDPSSMATRKSSQVALEAINGVVTSTIGGSADLTGSNNTKTSQTSAITAADFSGRYLYYGVREFAMGAVMNGMSLHGGIIPYGGTFLVFSDYCRPAIRLSALMGQRVIYVMTHDSIGLGEDGPTHQPVEHLASLRAIPGLNVFRPADSTETAECWQLALKDETRPSVIALSRQGLTPVRTRYESENMCAKGGYSIGEASGQAKVVLIATGSEVSLALEAQRLLEASGTPARVVSMPSQAHFDRQPEAYRRSVLGQNLLRVSIEAGTTRGWERYVGIMGLKIGVDEFGRSAPGKDVFAHFGLTPKVIAERVEKALKRDK